MDFRHDINGLRALAVGLVVVFHFNHHWLPGGFVGVDVFFVISGFLMTRIVVTGLNKETFSLLKFYQSRAKRIVPALAVMCFAVLAYGWFTLYTIEYQSLSKHAYSSLLFYSNFIYWQESGYFSAHAHENWLLHTWSLSVEWQFYLIYPVILLAVVKLFSTRWITPIVFIGFVSSFALSIFAANKFPDVAYFLLPTRAWQMLAGGLVFLFPLYLSRPKKIGMTLVGLLTIAISAFAIDNEVPWPGWFASLPIIGACLVLMANHQSARWTHFTGLQKVGLWSYSIYLWHWPVVVFINNLPFAATPMVNIVGIALSVLLGFLSFKFVENSSFSRMRIPAFALSLVAAFSIFEFGGANTPMRPISQAPENAMIIKYKNLNTYKPGPISDCSVSKNMKPSGIPELADYCVGGSQKGGIFIWGDSHAGAISTGIRDLFDGKLQVNQVTSSGCRPSFHQKVGDASKLRRACDLANQLALESIQKLEPQIVIIAQKDRHESMDWENTVAELKAANVAQIVLIGPVPQWYPSLPTVYAKHGNRSTKMASSKLDSNIVDTHETTMALMQRYPDINYIPVLDFLCPLTDNQRLCSVMLDDELISFDYGHLTEAASRFVAKKYVSVQLHWANNETLPADANTTSD